MSQPDDDPAIQEFRLWANRNRIYSMLRSETDERAAFNPIPPVKAYFEGNTHKKLINILAALFRPDEPPDLADIIVESYTAVFCILLYIGKGRFIVHFAEHGNLDEQHLPFEPSAPPANFPDSADPHFYHQFCKTQWRFTCPTLHPRRLYNQHFNEERILPIVKREVLSTGGSATLYRIKIHELHNELLPKEARTKLSGEYANTFVLKAYLSKDAEKHHENEVTAFRRLNDSCNIIGYYGSYIQGETRNIILQYADKGSLEEYFSAIDPPDSGEDILKFWENMFRPVRALMAIHKVKPQGSSDGPPIFQGLHQDVKPANILVVSNEISSPYEWQFKLGDLGLSQFEKISSLREGAAVDGQGTRTYGAPECYRADDIISGAQLPVKPSADIWSLGGIYSEAARWVVKGKRGLELYRRERLAETQQIPNFRDGDCFHDGRQRLGAVDASHKTTSRSLRNDDTITRRVLEKMVEEMLHTDQDARPNAIQLWAKVSNILAAARADLNDLTMKSLGKESKTYSDPNRPPTPNQVPPGIPPFLNLLPLESPAYSISQNLTQRASIGANSVGSILTNEDQSHSPESWTDDERPTNRAQNLGKPIRGLSHNEEQLPASPTQSKHARSGSNNGSTSTRQRMSTGGRFIDMAAEHGKAQRHQERNALRGRGSRVSFSDHGLGKNVLTQNNNRNDLEDPRVLASHVAAVSSAPRRQDSGTNLQTPPASPLGRNDGDPATPSSIAGSQASYSHGAHLAIGTPYRQQDDHDPPVTEYHPQREITNLNLNSPPQTAQLPRKGLPYWSVEEVLEWKELKKKSMPHHRPPIERTLLERLEERDHVFLIDDSTNMRTYWKEVKRVFSALCYLVKKLDDDGIDLYFTNTSKSYKFKDTKPFIEILDRKSHTGDTDIELRLQKILQPYKERLEKHVNKTSFYLKNPFEKKLRPMSIYVLTDGCWEHACTGDKQIKNLVEKLVELKLTKEQVGIQFISFGQDQTGLQRLVHLDSNLGAGLDIVDTTPWDGNVWKMLLGAINPTYDIEGEPNANSAFDSISSTG